MSQIEGAAVGKISFPLYTLTITDPERAVSVKTRAQFGVDVYCPAGNSGDVYVGESDVDGTDKGRPIPKGTSVFVPIDDASKLYFKGAVGDKISLMVI